MNISVSFSIKHHPAYKKIKGRLKIKNFNLPFISPLIKEAVLTAFMKILQTMKPV